MVKIAIDYEGDLHCRAVHEPSGSLLATDAPKDNQGKGEAFSPTDLVATALGCCMMTIMAIAAAKHGWDLKGTRVEVEKEMVSDPERRIGQLTVSVTFPRELGRRELAVLEQAARHCPVHKSLHPDVRVPLSFGVRPTNRK